MKLATEKERFWRKKISEWKRSEISKEQFCRKNDLSFHSFGYWYSKIRKTDSHENSEPKFMKLSVEVPRKTSATIVAPNGIKIIMEDLDSIDSIVEITASLAKKLNEKH